MDIGRLKLRLTSTGTDAQDPLVASAISDIYAALYLLNKDIALCAGFCVLTASVAIARGQAVNINSSQLRLADKDLARPAVGISVGGATAGQPCRFILLQGYAGDLSGLTPNSSIYLGAAGALLTAKPGVGLVQGLGFTLSATEMLVNVSQP